MQHAEFISAWADWDKRQKLERRAAVEKALEFGPIPVPQDTVDALCNLFITDAIEALRKHPGFEFEEKIRSLRTTLKLFERATADLATALTDFQSFSESSEGQYPSGLPRTDELESRVRKEIFAFCALAHSLQDHCRRVRSIWEPADFADRMHAHFGMDGLHDFICGIRTALHHVSMIEADWSVQHQGTETSSQFTLSKIELQGVLDNWSKSALGYLDRAPEKIDIGELGQQYASRVGAFYSPYLDDLEQNLPANVHDYRRCWRTKRAHDHLSTWKFFVQMFLQNNVDPLQHLHKFLKPDDLQRAQNFPSRSREQVDFVVSVPDTYGTCDDEMRKLAYQLFLVPEV